MKKTYVLTLKAGDTTIAERRFATGDAAIEIGRSHRCALQTPAEDSSVSGHHARLFWKGDTAWIEDEGSRNGVYRNEKRISGAARLESGVVFGLGGCSLSVSAEDGRRTAHARKHHQLRFVGGDRDGETVDIVPNGTGRNAAFTIGLDATCGLRLQDLMVSRRHASILVQPGGDCHVRDEDSRNGTYVNGEKLGTTPRLLKDGDKISIAYFDLRFLDRSKAHPDPHPMRRLVVLAASALVIAAGWFVWNVLMPRTTADDYRKMAMRAAAAEQFAPALAYMDSADQAKNASVEEPQNAALRGQIVRWQGTLDAWKRVRGFLSQEDVRSARLILGELDGPNYSWTWNDTTAREMRETAEFYRTCVRALTDADEAGGRLDDAVDAREDVAAALAKLDAFAAQHGKRLASDPALTVVRSRMDGFRKKLESIREGIARVNTALEALDAKNPDFRPLVAVFETVEADVKLPSSVRAYARGLLPTCRAFCATQNHLEREKAGICELELAGVRRGVNALPLPTQDECARNARLSDARAAFLRRHEFLQKLAANLSPMVATMGEYGVKGGEKGSVVAFATKKENWDRVFAFDCFEGRFPAASRVDPCGVYDEMLGLEFVYENLRELPKPLGRKNEALLSFTPVSCTARLVFLHVQTFVGFMNRSECAEFRVGKLEKLRALGTEVLSDRVKLVADLKARAADRNATPRAKLIAGCYAEFFSSEPSYAARRDLEIAFKKHVRDMNVLAEEFENENDPVKHIKLRKTILERGIPGEEIVRKCWAESEE